MRILSTHHVAISTPDLARLRAFYTETLALPVVGGFPGQPIIFVGAGDSAIEIEQEIPSPDCLRRSGWNHVAWQVEDVDAAYAELSARGVVFDVAPEDFPPAAPTMRIAFFRDPDGNLVELIRPLGDRYPAAFFDSEGSTTMTQAAVNAIPDGLHTITPHIVVRGAARAAEWYGQALGAVERSRVAVPGGKLMSVELWFGDSAVMVADEFPELGVLSPQSIGGTPVVLNLFTEDVDALWRRAVDAGAEVVHPLQDQFWGDRQGQITDPFGHRWGLAQHVRDVPPEEIARAAAQAFGG
jgi:PhnB protein